MRNIQLVMGCVHNPFHNKKMHRGVLHLIRDIKPNGINLLGDIQDMNSFGDHDKGQYPLITAVNEYKLSVPYYDEIDEALGRRKVEKRFIYGNHEDRWLRAQNKPDEEKKSIESPEERMGLRERGYEVKTNWKDDYFTLGDHLEIFHGSLLGVNPAKSQLDKLKKSCMFVHSHRFGTHYDGEMAAFNIGWGGDPKAPAFNYASRLIKRNWINGFALVTIDDNGYYYAQPITVFKDIFYYNGKKYGG